MLAAGEARLLFRGPRTLSNRKERGWRGRAFSRRCHFRSAAPLDGSHGDRRQEFVVGLVGFGVYGPAKRRCPASSRLCGLELRAAAGLEALTGGSAVEQCHWSL